MIFTLWDSLLRGLTLLISTITSETGILLQVVDTGKVYNLGEIASLELEVTTNGTAPGAAKTVTMWYAFASKKTYTPAQLASAASTVCALPNASATVALFNTANIPIGAQYLYVWFDHTAVDAGATLALVLKVNAKRA